MARRTTTTPPPEDFEENIVDIDVTDERSVSAAVRDAVAAAQPVTRTAR